MGSVTRAMTRWFAQNAPSLKVAVVDPRGEGSVWKSLVRLPLAMAQLIWLRWVAGQQILHLQVSERVSFVRKGALLAAAKAMGMRVVLHHHGAELIPFFQSTGWASRRFVRWVVRTADVNIVLGEIWRAFLIDQVGCQADRVVVCINATADIGTKEQPAPEPWHFLLIANLSPRKGVSELLKATAALMDKGRPVRLTLAGGGAIERYKTEAKHLGIDHICQFTGWIAESDISTLLLSGANLVLPSHHEGLPMTLLEALSAQTPIITTPVGSIPEFFQTDFHCLFVEPGNPEQLQAAMERLATRPDLRRHLTQNGRQLFETRFDLNHYMGKMLAIYDEINSR